MNPKFYFRLYIRKLLFILFMRKTGTKLVQMWGEERKVLSGSNVTISMSNLLDSEYFRRGLLFSIF